MPNAKAGEVKAPCTLTSRSTHLQKPAPTLLRCWLNTPPELLPTQQGGPNSRAGRAVHRSPYPKFPNVGPHREESHFPGGTGFPESSPLLHQDHKAPRSRGDCVSERGALVG